VPSRDGLGFPSPRAGCHKGAGPERGLASTDQGRKQAVKLHHGGRRGPFAPLAGAITLFISLLVALVALSSASAAPARISTAGLAYDVVSANGTVTTFGDAPNYGGVPATKLRAPIAGIATTPDGRGYWLVGENGSVYPRGDARFYGSLGSKQLPSPAHRIIAIVAAPGGRGYWLCDASGEIHSFGSARRLPSLPPGKVKGHITGFAVAGGGKGAWVVTWAGIVYPLGNVRSFGEIHEVKLPHPIVAMAANTKSTGYWLIDSAGNVRSFGAARRATRPPAVAGHVVAMTAAPASRGFWAVSSGGSVLHGGVPSLGGLKGLSGGTALVGIAASVPVNPSALAYDLVSANGTVTTFGGAGNYGGIEGDTLKMPVGGIAPTPDGRGYWIFTKNGGVYAPGDANFYGSLGGKPLPTPAHYVIALVPTPDGDGYWLCDASGQLHAYGDAAPIASLPASYDGPPLVGFAVLPGETGAIAVDQAGGVHLFGTAKSYGSLTGRVLSHPIVSMALTIDAKGYWMVDSAGDVFSFGDATAGFAPPHISSPVVAMTAAGGGVGYWAVTSSGQVLAGGVPSKGGLVAQSGPDAIVGMTRALALSSTQQSPYPPGSIGYDVNWPQCNPSGSVNVGTLPGPSFSVAIVGVDGWSFNSDNSCLKAEVGWAERARVANSSVAPPYQLYIFLNSPGGIGPSDKTGPAGTCAALAASARPSCYAYNYGYNSALQAFAYASSQGAKAPIWWLDVENDSCANTQWSDLGAGSFWSCTPKLNDRTIQGAADGLRHERITVGVYSDALQWNIITDHFVPAGPQLPLWIAGAAWTSPPYPADKGYPGTAALSPWCSGNYDFGGGVPSLLQETPGTNGYPFDPDYAC
jgi:hypothetical protein